MTYLENLSEQEQIEIGKKIKEASKLIGDFPVMFNVKSINADYIPSNTEKYGTDVLYVCNDMPKEFSDLNMPNFGIH